MDKTEMTTLLRAVADGTVSPEDAALRLKFSALRRPCWKTGKRRC